MNRGLFHRKLSRHRVFTRRRIPSRYACIYVCTTCVRIFHINVMPPGNKRATGQTVPLGSGIKSQKQYCPLPFVTEFRGNCTQAKVVVIGHYTPTRVNGRANGDGYYTVLFYAYIQMVRLKSRSCLLNIIPCELRIHF